MTRVRGEGAGTCPSGDQMRKRVAARLGRDPFDGGGGGGRILNGIVHEWVRERGFDFFAQEGYRSLSLTCVRNVRDVDVAAWVARLREKHRMAIDGGYGKLKGKTFRISNMGDETEDTMRRLLEAMDDTLEC